MQCIVHACQLAIHAVFHKVILSLLARLSQHHNGGVLHCWTCLTECQLSNTHYLTKVAPIEIEKKLGELQLPGKKKPGTPVIVFIILCMYMYVYDSHRGDSLYLKKNYTL